MSGRALPEWCGASPETPPPLRVKLRIIARQNGRCESCGRTFDAKLKPEFDHNPALINGGENREGMIEAVCRECHRARTNFDVAEKADIYRKRAKHLGLAKPKGRGFRHPTLRRKVSGEVVAR